MKNMKNTKKRQAYKRAPWRIQRQIIGAVMAAVFLLALILALYLDITSQVSTIGRKIINTQYKIREVEDEIQSLESDWAKLTSVDNMKTRAEDLGFVQLNYRIVNYIYIENYTSEDPIDLLIKANVIIPTRQRMPDEYVASIFDWFGEVIDLIQLEPEDPAIKAAP
jgi:cell division protein FtsL